MQLREWLCGREGVLVAVACMVVLIWHRSSEGTFQVNVI